MLHHPVLTAPALPCHALPCPAVPCALVWCYAGAQPARMLRMCTSRGATLSHLRSSLALTSAHHHLMTGLRQQGLQVRPVWHMTHVTWSTSLVVTVSEADTQQPAFVACLNSCSLTALCETGL
jgi:hypothetical protein